MSPCCQVVPIAACISTLCDIIITSTIFKKLWRSELHRSNAIRSLVIVFINMGVLTWYAASFCAWCRLFITLISLMSAIVGTVVSKRLLFFWYSTLASPAVSQFLAQGDNYWVGAPAIILSRCESPFVRMPN